MAIYTKQGDEGLTGLPGGRRLAKSEPIFEMLGNLDLVNSVIGLTITFLPKKERDLKKQLTHIQQMLLSIGATLAARNKNQLTLVADLEKETKELEKQIDLWDEQLPEIKNFLLPGGSTAGAWLHLVRTLVRQTERSYQRLKKPGECKDIAVYLNRLSDYFFQAACYANFRQSVIETIWRD
ncbi:MAG TPA: cob(I)yrinic acid a,c-diamide adenosyltransferase [Candidatus Saccharimonadales bacterium]|nr:cob(I)yrinic acid a,c-diamide adenosyltransferase [Candidatus Saccharimonadales bacterium]